MCGINGVWLKDKVIDKHKFDIMRDTLIHRGPDGAGTIMAENEQLAFGHRRLAFMDLSDTGVQPMKSADSQIIITVNGEIYNYPELKNILEKAGHKFISGSDSEVIIHGWNEWGEKLPEKLNGMFAFALWDNKQKLLFLARDRFGIKPLYYYYNDNEFAFASELKALVEWNINIKDIDFSSMADFFTYRYVPSPKTIYKNVYKLPPAHCAIIKNVNTISLQEYYKLSDNIKLDKNLDIYRYVDDLLNNSVKKHMQSEVSVGAFLSGGYDSSALVSYLFRNNISVNTFSIGFKDWKQSEHQYAKIVAEKFNMPFSCKILDGESYGLLEKLVYHYDEPIADISIIPTYEVSKLAAEKNKAVISGEGADELFAGYTWHYENMNLQKQQGILNIFYAKNNRAFSLEAYSRAMAMGHLRLPELKELFKPDLHKYLPDDSDWFYRKHFKKEFSGLNSFRYLDIKCFMGELVLTKIDRASMANSLEVRVPFLENSLSENLFSLNEKVLYRNGHQKYLLKKIIEPYMPEEILNRKKQGFVGPDSYYFNKNWYAGIIETSVLISDEILQENVLDSWLKTEEYWKLWKFAIMEYWYRRWMKN